ncbi:MAG: hypothetical protein R3B13_11850 [Polyangiaceae bacterium]
MRQGKFVCITAALLFVALGSTKAEARGAPPPPPPPAAEPGVPPPPPAQPPTAQPTSAQPPTGRAAPGRYGRRRGVTDRPRPRATDSLPPQGYGQPPPQGYGQQGYGPPPPGYGPPGPGPAFMSTTDSSCALVWASLRASADGEQSSSSGFTTDATIKGGGASFQFPTGRHRLRVSSSVVACCIALQIQTSKSGPEHRL